MGAGDGGATPHSPREARAQGREWEMPVFRNASLPIKQEVLAFKAENGLRNKHCFVLKMAVGGNHLCKSGSGESRLGYMLSFRSGRVIRLIGCVCFSCSSKLPLVTAAGQD